MPEQGAPGLAWGVRVMVDLKVPGVDAPSWVLERFPNGVAPFVIQFQYYDLEVQHAFFTVVLSSRGIPFFLRVPMDAVLAVGVERASHPTEWLGVRPEEFVAIAPMDVRQLEKFFRPEFVEPPEVKSNVIRFSDFEKPKR